LSGIESFYGHCKGNGMKANRDTMAAVDANLLWAAACTAFRINNGYYKQPELIGDQIVRPTNRDLVEQALANAVLITDADRAMGADCRRHLASAVTMQALRTELNDWAKITARVCSLDTITSRYDMSVITAMPHGYARQLRKESVDARLARCDGLVGSVGDKVELTVEVLRGSYSIKFNTWFITAITDNNHSVYFSYRESIEPDTHTTIRGTVKRHNNQATQLNRVKVLGVSK
jgi:tellurite resistance protein